MVIPMSDMTRHAAIVGVGSYLPERRLTNADLEQMVDTTGEWIETRTGIRERRIAADGESTSMLASRAGESALRCAGISPDELDLIVVGTSTPDHVMPSTACIVQSSLGASCPAFDVNAACSGFVYALEVGASAIEARRAETVLVIGADVMSRIIDFSDRSTCVLFGDGAGAVVLRASDEPGVEAIVLGADGSGGDLLKVPAGGSARPCTHDVLDAREQYLTMNGNEVYRFAVKVIPRATKDALRASGSDVSDLDWLVPHQANQRILDTVGEQMGIPSERIFSNLALTGNTSAASIPLALDDLYTGGLLAYGDLLCLVGFGSGLTWGAAVVRWTMNTNEKENRDHGDTHQAQ